MAAPFQYLFQTQQQLCGYAEQHNPAAGPVQDVEIKWN
jgi:hypothetical protein